jgi:CysZ protein
VLGAGVGAFFLTLEFTDLTLARHGYRLRQRLQLLRHHPGLTAGFGLGTSLLLWIPVVNVLCVPIAVVGGTALALSLTSDAAPPAHSL